MVKNTYQRVIGAPRQTVFEILRDRQVELNKKLPNVLDSRVLEDCAESGSRRRIVTEATAQAPIPMLLRPVLAKKHLVWKSIQVWDSKKWTCDFETEALYFKENVDVRGQWTFEEKSPGSTTVRIMSIIKIDANGLPGLPQQFAAPVAALVEHILTRLTRPNLEKLWVGVEALLREERREARREARREERRSARKAKN